MLAKLTLDAIESALVEDQGAKFRTLLKELMPLAGDAYAGFDPIPFRGHLGASQIGRDCPREIWYSFRWASPKADEGRMIRLFNRGHLEEPRMVAMLKMIGVQVYQNDANGKQYRMTAGYKGHGGGGMDGVLLGVPEMPHKYVLGEFKTHGDKSFQKLKDDGLVKAKWAHYAQIQMYMGDQKLDSCLYMAVNKNDDELYGEIVARDALAYDRVSKRAIAIIDATKPPQKIGRDESDWKCKFCDHKPTCHLGAPMLRNCRTCASVTVEALGVFLCNRYNKSLTKQEQFTGCNSYEPIRDDKPT